MSTEKSKRAKGESIQSRQNRTTLVIALIGSASALLVGFVTAFFAFPPFQEWVRDWRNEQKVEVLEIEQTGQRVFAYYGEAANLGGFARLELIFDPSRGKPSYELNYSLPDDQKGYVGLAFQFTESLNLSGYSAVECTVVFNQLSDVVDLYFKDIVGNFNTIRVSNNGANEMLLFFEFDNFPDINFNAVHEFGIVVSTDFSTGSHKIQIKNVRFVE